MSPSSSNRLDPVSSSQSSTSPASLLPSARGWPARTTFSTLEQVADSEHVVQFYETAPFLVACVSRFLRGPLRDGGGAVVLATSEHLAELERSLDLEELSVEVAGRRGQYVALDAEETLGALMVDGLLDPERFLEVVGAHVGAVASRRPRLAVFDEMAGLLWARGRADAAQELEEQWRALAGAHRFARLSAYPVGGIASPRSAAALARMCSAHGRVLPPQRSSRVDWDRLLRRRWPAPADETRGPAYRSRGGTEAETAVADRLAVRWAASPGRRRVLLVDDNAAFLETLGTALTILGNEVRLATDGLHALEVGQDFHPDVIIMDLGMPKLNGYEAARRIRQLPWGEDVTLVALTGWGQPEHRRRSGEAGFDEHLVKPVAVAQLRRLLEEPVVCD